MQKRHRRGSLALWVGLGAGLAATALVLTLAGAALWRRSCRGRRCAPLVLARGAPLETMPSLESQRPGQQVMQHAQHAQGQSRSPSLCPQGPPAAEDLASPPPLQPVGWHSLWLNPLASWGGTVDAERRTTTTADGERASAPLRRMSRTLSGRPTALLAATSGIPDRSFCLSHNVLFNPGPRPRRPSLGARSQAPGHRQQSQ